MKLYNSNGFLSVKNILWGLFNFEHLDLDNISQLTSH